MLPLTDAPEESLHFPSNNQIVWNWTSVPEATGYRMNTENDYHSASDPGNSHTFAEAGLICNTPYTWFVWAYDSCGISATLQMNASTAACYSCNDSLVIYHLTVNGVAPVDKEVGYGMVSNVPGEPNKCWINSNLGLDHQAVSAGDNT